MPKQTYSEDRVEEYSKRTTTYADYMISEMRRGKKISVRGVAKAFKNSPNKDLSRSHVTIYKSLVEVLPSIDIVRYVTIKEILFNNKAKSIEDNKVRARVLSATKLLLDNYTINQIVDIMNEELDDSEKITFNTVYRDLTERLSKLTNIDELTDILEQVSFKLREHSASNLRNSNSRK